MYEKGVGVLAPNCTAAAEYLHVFLAERTGWAYDMRNAVKALDEGKPLP